MANVGGCKYNTLLRLKAFAIEVYTVYLAIHWKREHVCVHHS